MLAERLGFDGGVTGQTYSRKVDAFVLDVLSGIAQSMAKMATDIRLLARLKEVREPMASAQVGSSAMPYKANPMRSERITALARWLISWPPTRPTPLPPSGWSAPWTTRPTAVWPSPRDF